MNDFLSGVLVTGYAVIGLFFLRFWKQSRDRLVLFFALAFCMLAVQRLALTVSLPFALFQNEEGAEGHLAFYLMRLAAYVLILLAILDKNRRR
jgi:hypothetical protein